MEFAKANLTPKAVSLRYFTKEREDHWKCNAEKLFNKKRTKTFGKAVVKILNGDEKSLTTEEAQSVQKLKKQVVEQPEGSNSQDSDSDFASLLIKKRRLQLSSQKMSQYESLKFLLPTSNILERFFSSATYSFSDLRQKLLPMNLEMQLFLRSTKNFGMRI